MCDIGAKEPTHHDLWAGIDLKLDNAKFHLEGMAKALQPPERSPFYAAMEAQGKIINGGNWHRALYAHLDAFLSAARSVPEIIRCCFGVDVHPKLRAWFDALPAMRRSDARSSEGDTNSTTITFTICHLATPDTLVSTEGASRL